MACVDGAMPADKPTDDSVQCRPCKKAGLVINASKYCRPCSEYMCESCATIHKRFQESEHHDVVPASDLPSPGQASMTKLPMRFCSEHVDRDIDWYCDVHDVMLCDTCKRIKHRKCEATSISEMTNVSTELLSRAVDSIKALHCSISTLKSERQESTDALNSLKMLLVVDVNKLKTRLVEMVERLEAEILADIDKFVAIETGLILDHVKTCDDMLPHLETALGVADEAKAVGDEVTSVIAAVNLSKTLKELEPTVCDLQQELYSVDMSFEPTRTLTDILGGVDRLGTLNTFRTAIADRPHVGPPNSTCQPIRPSSCQTSWPDMEVETSAVINVPSDLVTGSAIMPDGRIVLADHAKGHIILLDVNFNMQSKLKLPHWPRDVAVDGANDVIVSMPAGKKLQWIHVDTDLRAGRVVTTGLGCWGIAVHKDEIYATVRYGTSGVISAIFGGGSFVQVLDRAGMPIRSIGDGARMFTHPNYITVSACGTVFVSDYFHDRVTCFTNGGNVVYDVKCDKNIRSPAGILADEDDNLLVCCKGSNDVRVLKKDGTFTKVALTSADGVLCPRSVSYRQSDGILILTMTNEICCRMYKLKPN